MITDRSYLPNFVDLPLSRLSAAFFFGIGFAAILSSSVFSLTLESTEGLWRNPEGSPLCLSSEWEEELRWGKPFYSDSCEPFEERSGYRFDSAPGETFHSGEVFNLGTFTHFNRPVLGGSINQVDLDLTINFSDPSYSTSLSFTFQHEETPNDEPCDYPGSTVCPDRVRLQRYFSDSVFGPINGKHYKLQIVGFAECGSPDEAIRNFYTEEEKENVACLYGRLITQEPDVRIEKSTEGRDADEPPGPMVDAGVPVSWTYEVTNVGNVPLSDIRVTDDNGTPADPADDVLVCSGLSLETGLSATCTDSALARPGQYSNTAEVTVTYEGTTFSDTDTSHYYGIEKEIELEGDPTLELVQKDPGAGQVALRDFTAGGPFLREFEGTISARVTASRGFEVGATYYTATEEDGARENEDGLLVLEDSADGDRHPLPFNSSYEEGQPKPGFGEMVLLTEDFQTCGSFCYEAQYSQLIDFSKIKLDYESNDTLMFYTAFWLYDTSA